MEIKEILDFKENADYKRLSCDETAILKDYITNLQQENTLLKHNCKQAQDSCKQHRLASKNHIRRLQRREKQLENYKSRIEKAEDYIEQYDGNISGYYYSKENKRFLVEENVKDDLLNILNGRSDE